MNGHIGQLGLNHVNLFDVYDHQKGLVATLGGIPMYTLDTRGNCMQRLGDTLD